MSKTDGIGQTNVGRNQLLGWKYSDAQLTLHDPNWFAQAYRAQSRSGNTFQLNGFAQNSSALPDDQRRLGSHALGLPRARPAYGGRAAEHVRRFRALNGTRLTWGGQYRDDVVSSNGSGSSIARPARTSRIDQKGVYAQTDDRRVTSMFDVVLAGRGTTSTISTTRSGARKPALLFTPVDDQTFRVTFNRAFKSPSILQTSFFFPDFQPFIACSATATAS